MNSGRDTSRLIKVRKLTIKIKLISFFLRLFFQRQPQHVHQAHSIFWLSFPRLANILVCANFQFVSISQQIKSPFPHFSSRVITFYNLCIDLINKNREFKHSRLFLFCDTISCIIILFARASIPVVNLMFCLAYQCMQRTSVG